MKVYISVDMEGIAGISHAKPTTRGDAGYPTAVELMDGEANAAIEGAFDGGATEVTVNDSHGGMFNLTPEQSSIRAPGSSRAASRTAWSRRQPDGASMSRCSSATTRAPGIRGAPSRTPTPGCDPHHARPPAGREYGINGLYLGALGVPVGMVTGDDALAEEVADWMPWAERVVVKHAGSGYRGDSVHPSVARDLVAAGARRAVERAIGGDQLRRSPCPRPSTSASSSTRRTGGLRGGHPGLRPEGTGACATAPGWHRRLPGVRLRDPAGRPGDRLSGQGRAHRPSPSSAGAPPQRRCRERQRPRTRASWPATAIGGGEPGKLEHATVVGRGGSGGPAAESPVIAAGPPSARCRPRDLGIVIGLMPPGPTNSIVDVPGVKVGHATVWRDEPRPPAGRGIARSGVTVVLPDAIDTLAALPIHAGVAVLNGSGEMTARTQIDEQGVIESPIFLTSTMAVGRVYDAAIHLLVAENPAADPTTHWSPSSPSARTRS